MQERLEKEQYFFDRPTVERLCGILALFARPCLLCAPALGRELAARGRDAIILDIDERFADVPGFRRWDLTRPEPLSETFDVIVCDPPFFNVSLGQVRRALRGLAHYDSSQRLMVSYLVRRRTAFLGSLAEFGLRPTGFEPKYASVEDVARNAIEFHANFGLERDER